MELQTQIPLLPSDNPIDYQSKVVLLGSCFVENMGEKLDYFKFPLFLNPFGILFHPLAIANLVERALGEKFYQQEEIFEQDGIWRCFDAHSDLRSASSEELLQLLNQRLKETKTNLEASSHIIITLGTVWVYEHTSTGKTVANCHKVPQKQFTKKLLSVAEIEASLQHIIALVSRGESQGANHLYHFTCPSSKGRLCGKPTEQSAFDYCGTFRFVISSEVERTVLLPRL